MNKLQKGCNYLGPVRLRLISKGDGYQCLEPGSSEKYCTMPRCQEKLKEHYRLAQLKCLDCNGLPSRTALSVQVAVSSPVCF